MQVLNTRCTAFGSYQGWRVSSTNTDWPTRVGGCQPTDTAGVYCCPETSIRSDSGLSAQLDSILARRRTASQQQQQPAQQQPSTGTSGSGSVVKDAVDAVVDGMSDALRGSTGGSVQKPGDQPIGEGGSVSKDGLTPQAEAAIGPDYGWFSQNWPYLALGGIAITAVGAILYFTTRVRPEPRGL